MSSIWMNIINSIYLIRIIQTLINHKNLYKLVPKKSFFSFENFFFS